MKVEDLKPGQSLLVSARGVKNGKVQLTFAQKISNPNMRPTSITAVLNASDERFTQDDKPRYAWHSGEKADIKKALGVDVDALAEGETKELGILNPEINGQMLNIQITETTEGDEYDVANFETRAKRAGKDGDFITTEDGALIYVRASVVPGPAKHVFIANTIRKSASASATDDAVASAIGG